VRIIVDANIVFSAILNSNGKIGDLLIDSRKDLIFLAPEFLRIEISKHYNRLSKISGLTIDQIKEAEFQIFKRITFISEEQIRSSAWLAAEKLAANIDPNDTPYLAYAKHFRCKLWSGDKQLTKGLLKKGVDLVITTDELYQWRSLKSKSK
jgi:predicted nucleic acid-binding protein